VRFLEKASDIKEPDAKKAFLPGALMLGRASELVDRIKAQVELQAKTSSLATRQPPKVLNSRAALVAPQVEPVTPAQMKF
jgi:hypothetical protein